jgi:hypothetical protein
VTYDAGPGWTRAAEALRLGTATFDLAGYGPSRCVNVDRPEGLLGSGLVPGTLDVDAALGKVLEEGLLPRLSGPRSMAVGGVPRDLRTGPATGRGATIYVSEDACVPADPMAPPVVLDLRGYPVHAPDGVAVVFLLGTLPPRERDRVLASVRVKQ